MMSDEVLAGLRGAVYLDFRAAAVRFARAGGLGDTWADLEDAMLAMQCVNQPNYILQAFTIPETECVASCTKLLADAMRNASTANQATKSSPPGHNSVMPPAASGMNTPD